jgi:hypothetical protein
MPPVVVSGVAAASAIGCLSGVCCEPIIHLLRKPPSTARQSSQRLKPSLSASAASAARELKARANVHSRVIEEYGARIGASALNCADESLLTSISNLERHLRDKPEFDKARQEVLMLKQQLHVGQWQEEELQVSDSQASQERQASEEFKKLYEELMNMRQELQLESSVRTGISNLKMKEDEIKGAQQGLLKLKEELQLEKSLRTAFSDLQAKQDHFKQAHQELCMMKQEMQDGETLQVAFSNLRKKQDEMNQTQNELRTMKKELKEELMVKESLRTSIENLEKKQGEFKCAQKELLAMKQELQEDIRHAVTTFRVKQTEVKHAHKELLAIKQELQVQEAVHGAISNLQRKQDDLLQMGQQLQTDTTHLKTAHHEMVDVKQGLQRRLQLQDSSPISTSSKHQMEEGLCRKVHQEEREMQTDPQVQVSTLSEEEMKAVACRKTNQILLEMKPDLQEVESIGRNFSKLYADQAEFTPAHGKLLSMPLEHQFVESMGHGFSKSYSEHAEFRQVHRKWLDIQQETQIDLSGMVEKGLSTVPEDPEEDSDFFLFTEESDCDSTTASQTSQNVQENVLQDKCFSPREVILNGPSTNENSIEDVSGQDVRLAHVLDQYSLPAGANGSQSSSATPPIQRAELQPMYSVLDDIVAFSRAAPRPSCRSEDLLEEDSAGSSTSARHSACLSPPSKPSVDISGSVVSPPIQRASRQAESIYSGITSCSDATPKPRCGSEDLLACFEELLEEDAGGSPSLDRHDACLSFASTSGSSGSAPEEQPTGASNEDAEGSGRMDWNVECSSSAPKAACVSQEQPAEANVKAEDKKHIAEENNVATPWTISDQPAEATMKAEDAKQIEAERKAASQTAVSALDAKRIEEERKAASQRAVSAFYQIAMSALLSDSEPATPRDATPRGATPRGATPRGATPRGATPRDADDSLTSHIASTVGNSPRLVMLAATSPRDVDVMNSIDEIDWKSELLSEIDSLQASMLANTVLTQMPMGPPTRGESPTVETCITEGDTFLENKDFDSEEYLAEIHMYETSAVACWHVMELPQYLPEEEDNVLAKARTQLLCSLSSGSLHSILDAQVSAESSKVVKQKLRSELLTGLDNGSLRTALSASVSFRDCIPLETEFESASSDTRSRGSSFESECKFVDLDAEWPSSSASPQEYSMGDGNTSRVAPQVGDIPLCELESIYDMDWTAASPVETPRGDDERNNDDLPIGLSMQPTCSTGNVSHPASTSESTRAPQASDCEVQSPFPVRLKSLSRLEDTLDAQGGRAKDIKGESPALGHDVFLTTPISKDISSESLSSLPDVSAGAPRTPISKKKLCDELSDTNESSSPASSIDRAKIDSPESSKVRARVQLFEVNSAFEVSSLFRGTITSGEGDGNSLESLEPAKVRNSSEPAKVRARVQLLENKSRETGVKQAETPTKVLHESPPPSPDASISPSIPKLPLEKVQHSPPSSPDVSLSPSIPKLNMEKVKQMSPPSPDASLSPAIPKLNMEKVRQSPPPSPDTCLSTPIPKLRLETLHEESMDRTEAPAVSLQYGKKLRDTGFLGVSLRSPRVKIGKLPEPDESTEAKNTPTIFGSREKLRETGLLGGPFSTPMSKAKTMKQSEMPEPDWSMEAQYASATKKLRESAPGFHGLSLSTPISPNSTISRAKAMKQSEMPEPDWSMEAQYTSATKKLRESAPGFHGLSLNTPISKVKVPDESARTDDTPTPASKEKLSDVTNKAKDSCGVFKAKLLNESTQRNGIITSTPASKEKMPDNSWIRNASDKENCNPEVFKVKAKVQLFESKLQNLNSGSKLFPTRDGHKESPRTPRSQGSKLLPASDSRNESPQGTPRFLAEGLKEDSAESSRAEFQKAKGISRHMFNRVQDRFLSKPKPSPR